MFLDHLNYLIIFGQLLKYMKKSVLIILLLAFSAVSCKLFLKSAAKHWTSKQIAEFMGNCKGNATKLMSDENATQYCDCAVDKVAKEYQDYADVKKVAIKEILKVASDCLDN